MTKPSPDCTVFMIAVTTAPEKMMAITPSWELKVNINEFDIVEQSLVVNGETHIGGVIIQLFEKLNHIRNDWSDFALWWPDKNTWLNKTKMTLDQYGVQADALLYFTRIHKYIRLQLPDQQILDFNVDFSLNVFSALKKICKELSIRHPEEVSLLRCTNSNNNNNNNNSSKINNKKLKNEQIENFKLSNNKENGSISSGTSTLNNSSSNSNSLRNNSKTKFVREGSLSSSIDNANDSLHSDSDQYFLYLSPSVSTAEYLNKNAIKYKSLFDRTRVNSRWLDSSKSLMEQNIKENDLVQIRFKYYAFLDLNIKTDLVRINQIYEQAKWSILSEEIESTEQELINFAALQLQVQMQTKAYNSKNTNEFNRILSNESTLSKGFLGANRTNFCIDDHQSIGKQSSIVLKNDLIEDEDDVDTALSKLEKTLDLVDSSNTNNNNNSQTNVENKNSTIDTFTPHSNTKLGETLLLMKPQKYTFKKFRPFYFTLDDTHYLSYYKSKQDSNGKPIDKINLKFCEVVPDVNLASRKFGINLRVPSSEGMNELSIRCDTEESYANWMSAFKLASKAKSLSDASFSIEVKSILNLFIISQQKTDSNQKSSPLNLSQHSLNYSPTDTAQTQATNLLPLRILKKYKLKQLNDRILEAYSTISELDLFEAKWRYIKAWQALPTYGISYFAVKIKGSKFKEELIGVTSNRLLRLSPEGETLKSWRFNSMKSWNVNWDTQSFEVIFDEEILTFLCLNCDAKILHEFIGAYIYLSLRQSSNPSSSNNNNNNINDEMFFKLTEKR